MALVEGFRPPIKATLQPSLTGSSIDDLKGLSRQRMRIDGKRVESKEEIEKAIIKLLAQPMTRAQLATALKRNPSTLWRDYLDPMLKRGAIEKSGDYYKRAGAAEVTVAKERFDDIVKKSAFAQLPILADFVAHMRDVKKGQWQIAHMHAICTGRLVPGFKCRPEHWTAETTQAFVAAYKQAKGKDRLGMNTRQVLRYMHEYVLKKPVTDAEKKAWGIDGKKDAIGLYRDVRLTEQQIGKLSQHYLDKGDLQTAAYVSAGLECFGRPESMFKAETSKFAPAEIDVMKATIKGWPEPIYDGNFIPLLQVLSVGDDRIKVEKVRTPVYEGQLYEGKTEDLWPKRILGKHAVKIFAEWMHERRNNPLLFGSGESYSKWTHIMVPILREGFREVGATHSYFYKKPLYSLRHCGAQMWLARTGYDYAGVAEMGWRDIATLHRWYGGYSFEHFMQKVRREYA